jgi:hypothetical protein
MLPTTSADVALLELFGGKAAAYELSYAVSELGVRDPPLCQRPIGARLNAC